MKSSAPKAIEKVRIRGRALRPYVVFALSLGVAGTLVLILYLASTSLPYFAASPVNDARFAALNQCLLEKLAGNSVGYAVCADGRCAAAYDGSQVAICHADRPAQLHQTAGVSLASFDFAGNLWLSTGRTDAQAPGLWLISPEGALQRRGELSALALVGHREGVVTLEASGALLSMDDTGKVLAAGQLPAAPVGAVHLTVDASGERLALMAGQGIFLYEARSLKQTFSGQPCPVEFLWWRPAAPALLVSCGPKASWALELDAATGQTESAQAPRSKPSVLLPRAALYVQDCHHLPCSAPPPD